MNFFEDAEEQGGGDPVLAVPPTLTAPGPRTAPARQQAPATAHPLAVSTHRAFAAGHIAGAEEDRWCQLYAAALQGARSPEDAISAAAIADVAYAALAQRRALQKTGSR